MKKAFVFLSAALFAAISVAQITVTLPQPSPKATLTQAVGITDITIEYSSPGVKGRKIWGDVVRYDMPWRAGANSPTKITFSKDVVIAGKEFPAGSYHLFITPVATGAWYIHFNNKGKSVFDYQVAGTEKVDIAKVREDQFFELKAEPRAAEFRERLAYDVQYLDDNTAEVALLWDKVRVGFRVDVQTRKHTYAGIAKTIEQGNGYARTLARSAEYALQQGDLENAAKWAKQSLAIQEGYFNTWIMAKVAFASKSPDNAHQLADSALKMIDADGTLDAGSKDYWRNLIKTESANWK